MSIMHCNKHGHWDTSNFWGECPRCYFQGIGLPYQKNGPIDALSSAKALTFIGYKRKEKPKKTFLGMTAVGWYLFLYIAVVLIAIAWIVISHVPVKSL